MASLKNMIFSKPKNSPATPTVSKKLNGILRNGSTSPDSLDSQCNDLKCNNCSEHQSVTISLSENSGEDSDSCISCRNRLIEDSKQSESNSKRVSFNARVKKRVFLSDATERTRERVSVPTVRHSIHNVPNPRCYVEQPRYILCTPGHLGPYSGPVTSAHTTSSRGTLYFRII